MHETISCSRGALLDTWSGHHWQDGLQIETLCDLSTLRISTENSTYEMVVINAGTGDILIRGGRFFADLAEARLAGSSMGGSFLKVRGIYVGFHMELHVGQRLIVTSRVRSIETL